MFDSVGATGGLPASASNIQWGDEMLYNTEVSGPETRICKLRNAVFPFFLGELLGVIGFRLDFNIRKETIIVNVA